MLESKEEGFMKILVGLAIGIVTFFVAIAGGVMAAGIAPLGSISGTGIVQAAPPLQATPTPTAVSADMIITVSERFMNQEMVKGVPPGGQIQNPQVNLHAGQLADFTALVQLNAFMSVNPTVSVRFSVQNGRVVIDVLQVQVGGIGVPSSLIEPQIAQIKTTAETELNRQFAAMQAATGLQLKSLTTTEDSLTLSFAP
jgi:hypothetical protein